VDEFLRFWSACGCRQIRIKEDETNLCSRIRPRRRRLEVSVPLFVARSDVREAQRRSVSVLPELHAGRRAGGQYRTEELGDIWNSDEMRRMRRLHVGPAGEIDICSRCCTTIPHPLLVAGSCCCTAKRAQDAAVGGAFDVQVKEAAGELPAAAAQENRGLVQISAGERDA